VGVPLVIPLMMLVFFGSFFPVVGAFLSGSVAVAVAFVSGGVGDALVVLAVVVAVQQFEGHILYPIIFRRALSLHPLVILLAIGVGAVAFGIVGAFLAVPLTAVAVAVHQAVVEDPDSRVVALLTDRPYERVVAELPGSSQTLLGRGRHLEAHEPVENGEDATGRGAVREDGEGPAG
jgi:predicted PurR-regulated permease PerM